MTVEMWYNRDREAALAHADRAALDRFARENRRFILRCASKVCKRFITDSDEEYEIALVAFCEAVERYDPDSGGFNGFAALVIRRRLMDYFDSVSRRQAEVLAGSAMTWDEVPEDGQAGVIAELQQQLVADSRETARTVRDEIEALGGVLRDYGFTFFDLADASPRAEKTKQSCARAVRWLIASQERMDRLRKTRALPVRELADACDISRKLLDRHRRYIIAAAEILRGDYPQIAEYLGYMRDVK